jgi:hypothetical protein
VIHEVKIPFSIAYETPYGVEDIQAFIKLTRSKEQRQK